MALLPHDVTDLYLAPVVLALEARIEELARLDLDELAHEVALIGGKADWTSELRADGLLETVRHLVACHDWYLRWDPRGLRVSHGEHQVVLGVPDTFTAYVLGSPERSARELLH